MLRDKCFNFVWRYDFQKKIAANMYRSRKVDFNFPFAFFTQLFFIQPDVRTIFKLLFAKDIKARQSEQSAEEKAAVNL